MTFPPEIDEEIQQLVGDLTRDDELGSVVRAHIRVEITLLSVVERLMPYPKHLKKLEFDYDKCVTLAMALGLKEQYGPPLRALGKLRNDFAHKPAFTLTRHAVTNLYSSLHAEDKVQLQATFERIKRMGETTRNTPRFTALDPKTQFDLIAVTIWSMIQGALLQIQQERGST